MPIYSFTRSVAYMAILHKDQYTWQEANSEEEALAKIDESDWETLNTEEDIRDMHITSGPTLEKRPSD